MKQIVVLVGLLLLVGCSAPSEDTITPNKIDAKTAKSMMNEEGVLIVDVRTEAEYNEGHVPGAILLPHDQILGGELGLLPDKEQTLLLYCRSGNRSGQAASYLAEAGYTAIYDFGGIKDWPYETEK